MAYVDLYEITFSDLSHILSLSKDCFNIIKEFCGRSYYGDFSQASKEKLFLFACKYGLYTVIGDLFRENVEEVNVYEGFYTACEYGHLNIISWIKFNYPNSINGIFEYGGDFSFRVTCHNGRVNVLKWMHTNIPLNLLNNAFWSINYRGFYYASRNNHLDVLKWMQTTFRRDLLNNAFNISNYLGYYTAHEKNHQNIINWMETTFPSHPIIS